MFTDFLGAALNLTQLSGSSPVYRLEFVDDSEAAMDLGGVTFSGTVTACSDGQTYPLGVGVSAAETNVIGLSFPSLALGNYNYEVMATDDSGEALRIVYGQILVMATSLTWPEAEEQTIKRLQVREPGAEAKQLQLKWLASSIAQLSAEEAAKSAAKAEAAAADAEKKVQEAEQTALENIQTASDEAAETLNTAITEATKTISTAVDEGLQEFETAQSSIDESVERAETAADNAEADAAEIKDTMQNATDFMADFETRVESAISIRGGVWYIGNTSTGVQATGDPGECPKLSTANTWLIYDNTTETWTDTGVRAEGIDGIDGIDGDTVRRILVDSYADIPQSGETCNGGYYYYVWQEEVAASAATGYIDYSAGLTNALGLEINGVAIPDDESGLTGDDLVNYWVDAIDAANLGVDAEALTDESRIYISARVPGDVGNYIALELTNEETTATLSGATLTGGEDAIPAHYDVYAWIQDKRSSTGEWVKIGERNDVATSTVYGLVKLSTDVRVNDGGLIGTNTAGQMLARPASYGSYGAVKPSSSNTPGTYCIGINDNGTLGINKATLDYFGVVKLGSAFENKNDIPYRIGIGVTDDWNLCTNILWSGAVQFRTNDAWLSLTDKMPWLKEEAADHPDHYADKYGLALLTSTQFWQSESDGLVLQSATTTLKAGVYLATGLDDERKDAVMTAAQSKAVKDELDQNLADTKAELTEKYDGEVKRLDQADATLKTELTEKYDAEVDRLDEKNAELTDTFKSYYTQEEVNSLLSNQYNKLLEDVKAWVTAQSYDTVASVNAKLTGYVKTTETVTEIQALTTEEFNNLTDRNDTTLYLN